MQTKFSTKSNRKNWTHCMRKCPSVYRHCRAPEIARIWGPGCRMEGEALKKPWGRCHFPLKACVPAKSLSICRAFSKNWIDLYYVPHHHHHQLLLTVHTPHVLSAVLSAHLSSLFFPRSDPVRQGAVISHLAMRKLKPRAWLTSPTSSASK